MSKSIYIGATLLFIITAFSSPRNTNIKAQSNTLIKEQPAIERLSIIDSPILTNETKQKLEESYKNIDEKIKKAEKESSKLQYNTEKTTKQAIVIENLIVKDTSIIEDSLIVSPTLKDTTHKERWIDRILKNLKNKL